MKYTVIVKTKPQDAPKDFEMSAALILAGHLKTDLVFLRPGNRKTPDLEAGDIKWELKSPTGNGKRTMDNNLRGARKQSNHIVIDLRRCKMHQTKALSRIKHYLKQGNHGIKKLKVIEKSKKVVDIIK